jgi:putative flippase GtrA
MITFLKKQLAHDAHPLVQFIKYGIVGGMATGVHIVTFFLFAWLLFPCLTANDITVKLLGMSVQPMTDSLRAFNALLCNIGGFCISNVFCYILNRLFVFKPGKHHILLEFLLFFGVSGISLAVAAGVQTLLIRYLAIQTTYAFGANILCALFINYATRKFIIFKG